MLGPVPVAAVVGKAPARVSVRILEGDCCAVLPTLPAGSVQCVVTSPPYWGLRDYGVAGQLGLEPTPGEYLARMVGVFREVRRVLRDDGTCWLNMGDSYANAQPRGSFGDQGDNGTGPHGSGIPPRDWQAWGLKPKDLAGMPWRLAFALQADGWYLRADIIWAKPNPMPESVTDRPTKAHEYVFLLTKSARYYYDADAVREPNSDSPCNQARAAAGLIREQGPKAATLRAAARTVAPGNGNGINPRHAGGYGVGRNLRSVWTINPEPTPDAHFATFPRALVAPCILAGTSERGCCAACGAPWVRQVEAENLDRTRRSGLGVDCDAGTAGRAGSLRVLTRGWQPTCDHEAPTVPCTVLDPFGGTGTVARVAEDLGRDSILIELQSTYVDLARRKTAQMGLFSSRPAPCATRTRARIV